MANIIEIFQNAQHVDLFRVAASRVVFAHLTRACFSTEAYSEPLQASKMKSFLRI